VRGGRTPGRAPWWVLLVIAVAVGVFCFGTGKHIVDLAQGGRHAYAGAPGWIAGFWAALTVLDAACAVLLVLRRRAGAYLGCALMIADLGTNFYQVCVREGQSFLGTGVGRIALFTAFLLAVTPLLRPHLR
jgi:hypothetical protein